MRGDPHDTSHGRDITGTQTPDCSFLGESEAARAVRKLIGQAARVDLPVLVTGESGVGKELVAHEIHIRSPRAAGPFVPLNCSAIPDTLIENELFGHDAGAYTDARSAHRGAFESAKDGTLFLDEVGDLSLTAQPKLLRAIETGEIQRVGGESIRNIDLRLVAATNRDLRALCAEGRFRSDLYYRLCVFELHVPPLRERLDDLELLADHFLRALARKLGRPAIELGPGFLARLREYRWPGNVRELRHVIERAMAMTSGPILDPDWLQLPQQELNGGLRGLLEENWRRAREGFAALYVQHLLDRHGGNVPEAARAAGLATGSFYKMIRRLGLRRGGSSD